MSISVEILIELRNRSLDDYVDGRIGEHTYRADLDAIAVEIDRITTSDGEISLEDRAVRVVAVILADGRARSAVVAPARAARLEYWRGRRPERLADGGQHDHGATLDQDDVPATEPDEVRMARPILAALCHESIARTARARVQAIARKRRPETDPRRAAAFPDVVWTEDDRLSWEELVGGVPCQGCGMAVTGDETDQRDGEPWPAYRERRQPIEIEFKSRHPDHGTRWTAGGGPLHCSRCCPPPPLSLQQIERITQILSQPTATSAQEVPVRHCGTCHRAMVGNHVCQLADLPKKLRAVVDAVLEQERGQQRESAAMPDHAQGSTDPT